jgi:methylated-DNA-protein-cysteine methyltransferase-like protein
MDASSARQRILEAIRAVPRGQVRSYGDVARAAGLPGRARLVARVLSGNDEQALPWHRVLRADGRIAFPVGSAGHDEQVRRLQAEGVPVREGGRVDRVASSADRDLDAALWHPDR